MVQFFANWITPNQLTVARIFMIPVIFVLILMDQKNLSFLATILFVLACLTDYWDGALARHLGSTKLGKLLDPMADKLLISSVMVALVYLHRAPVSLVAILLAREFAMSGLRTMAVADGIVIQASMGGKVKTNVQMFASGFLIGHHTWFGIPFHQVGIILLWIGVTVSVWSSIIYFIEYYRAVPEEDVSS